MNRIEYVYLSIKDAHDRQYNYIKITIFTLIGMISSIGFNIQDIQIHVNIQFCNYVNHYWFKLIFFLLEKLFQ
jgi:hypothetical protein